MSESKLLVLDKTLNYLIGEMAQSVECLLCKQKAVGSIPAFSSPYSLRRFLYVGTNAIWRRGSVMDP